MWPHKSKQRAETVNHISVEDVRMASTKYTIWLLPKDISKMHYGIRTVPRKVISMWCFGPLSLACLIQTKRTSRWMQGDGELNFDLQNPVERILVSVFNEPWSNETYHSSRPFDKSSIDTQRSFEGA